MTHNKTLTNRLASKRGLTLLEIMMVIALLGLILGFIGKNVFSRFSSGKQKITQIYLSEINGALQQYKLDCNDFPKNIEALVTNPGDCPAYAVEGYIKKSQLKDPFNCSVSYSYDGGNIALKSLGDKCQEGGEGQATDILFQE